MKMLRRRYVHPSPIFMPTDTKEAKKREEERKENSGKPDSKIGFGGSISDIGDKDAKGVGEGK